MVVGMLVWTIDRLTATPVGLLPTLTVAMAVPDGSITDTAAAF